MDPTLGTSNIEEATVGVKKEMRGAVLSPQVSQKKTYTAEEKRVCSIETMKNGEECEACQ